MKRLILFAAFLVTAVAAGRSFAGYRLVQTPWIVKNADGSGRFYGNWVGAHNSADNLAYIGCYIYSSSVTCSVRDPSGVSGSCSTTNAGLMQVARSIDTSTALSVSYDSSATCTNISAAKYSQSLP